MQRRTSKSALWQVPISDNSLLSYFTVQLPFEKDCFFENRHKIGLSHGSSHRISSSLSLTIVGCFALIALCLPLGGAHYPYMWCAISESMCDMANDLLRCDRWNAKDLDFSNKEDVPLPKVDPSPRKLAKALPADF